MGRTGSPAQTIQLQKTFRKKIASQYSVLGIKTGKPTGTEDKETRCELAGQTEVLYLSAVTPKTW